MRSVAALTWHSLRRFSGLLLISGLVLAGFQIVLVAAAAYLDRSHAFSQFALLFPPFVREMMGPMFFAMLSFTGVVCLGYFHIAVLSTLVGLMVALGTEPTAEIESGFADLILAKPMPRHVPITRTVIILILSATLLLGLMMIGTFAGLALLAPQGSARPALALVLRMSANLGSLLLCWGSLALAAGSCVRRRAVPGAIVSLLALVSFLLVYLGQLWKPAEGISRISPFYYFRMLQLIVKESFPLHDISILLGVALCGIVFAYVVYAKRDL